MLPEIAPHRISTTSRTARLNSSQALNEVRNAYMAGWIKARRKQISHTLRSKVGFLALLGQVTFQFVGMAGARGRRNRADPYLVAYAAFRNRTENPTRCVVVCAESATKRPNRKLPTACKAFDVEPISLPPARRPLCPQERPNCGHRWRSGSCQEQTWPLIRSPRRRGRGA
jgi:hypothetical protein